MSERVTVAAVGGTADSAALEWADRRAHSGGSAADVTTMRSGSSHSEIIAASHHADLLVIGAAATSQRAGRVNGTLPLKIAGQAACTVIVVPAGWEPISGPVVVGWNDDPTADSALDFAAREASVLAVALTVVHTFNPPQAAYLDSPAPTAALAKLMAANRRLLAAAVDRIRLAYPSLTLNVHMGTGSAAVAIIRAARGASLLVVGSRGRGAIAGFFLGSVSHDVLLNLPAPVAVVLRKTAADSRPTPHLARA